VQHLENFKGRSLLLSITGKGGIAHERLQKRINRDDSAFWKIEKIVYNNQKDIEIGGNLG